jgi:HlyD family secretion protein
MEAHKIDLSALSRSPATGAPKMPAAGAPPAGHTPRDALPVPGRRWKTRILLPGVILGSAALLLAYASREALMPAADVLIAPVLLRQSEGAGQVGGEPSAPAPGGGSVVQAPGWVEADPFAINISALADGVVREVLVLEGETVQAGQVVARLIDDDARLALAAAAAELAEREAQLASAGAELAAAEMSWDNPVERRRMLAVSQAMASESRAELLMLDPEIVTESARLQELREEYTRLLRLRESQALAEGDLVRVEQRLRAQEGMLAAAQARRAILDARLSRQEAEVEAARDNLRLRIEERLALDRARAALAQQQAALARALAMRDEAALRLARMEITSPASGTVLARMIEPGTRLMTADDMNASLVIRLYNPEKLQIRVDIPLADAMRVGIGQEAQIATEAIPNRTFSGRISRLIHEANIQKNTVQVKVQVTDPAAAGALRPEMLTRVRFEAGSAAVRAGPAGASGSGAPSGHTMLAPRGAIIEASGAAARVWVLDQPGRAAALREVRLGAPHGADYIEVLEGLRPGDRVIVGPPASLRQGSRVNVSEWTSAAAGRGGAS